MFKIKNSLTISADMRHKNRVMDFSGDTPVVGEEFFVQDLEHTYFLADTVSSENKAYGETIIPYASVTRAKLISTVEYPLHDYQDECAKFVIGRFKSKLFSVRVLITLDPGKGKTYVATYILSKMNKRFSVVVLAQYIEKWIGDLTTNLNLTMEDIYVVRGGKSLAKLMKMKKKDVPKVVIYSNRTLVTVMKCLTDGSYDDKYSMKLQDLMKHTNTNCVILDEVHEEFNSIHKCMTMLNPNRILGLSATFDSDRGEIKHYMEEMFPMSSRINPLSPDKYRNVVSIEYPIKSPVGFNVRNWHTKFYSHIEFEKSILKNSRMRKEYINMIENTYVKFRDSGKFLIFVASLAMIKVLKESFERRFRGKKITRYTGVDPLSNLMDTDICFSTLGSAGTALDIPELSKVLLTVSISSTNANIQAFGRLRDLGKRDTTYIYLWSPDLTSHQKHHSKKMLLHKPYAKRYVLLTDTVGVSC